MPSFPIVCRWRPCGICCAASVLPASAMRMLATPAPAAASRPAAIPAAVDVAVVGAGVIGLSIAWRLAQRGLSVAVFERAGAGAGASLAATGMLAAAAEHEPGDPELLALALESQRLWPAFGRALEAQSGLDIDFRESGTLVVALGRDEVERLRFRHELQRAAASRPAGSAAPEVRDHGAGAAARRSPPGCSAPTTIRSIRGW